MRSKYIFIEDNIVFFLYYLKEILLRTLSNIDKINVEINHKKKEATFYGGV